MEKDSIVKKTTVKTSKLPTKSRRKVSIKEFSASNNLRPEVEAGFTAWLKGDIFHFDNEWRTLFKEYNKR